MDIAEQRQEFQQLLAAERDEQVYQSFLERHTRFIPREFIQNHGIANSLVLRKLGFGPDYKCDFFYFSKSSDDWNAVFVELEKPQSRFFKQNSNDFHRDFSAALQQIGRWKAWFVSDQNHGAFLSTVSAIQVPRHMARNPTYRKYVLVIGRRSEYEANEERRRIVKSAEAEDLKIITFDSLLEDLESKPDLSVGSRHNEFMDILTDQVTSPTMYAWIEPTQLRVSKTLHAQLKAGNSSCLKQTDEGLVDALAYAASRVRVRAD